MRAVNDNLAAPLFAFERRARSSVSNRAALVGGVKAQ